MDGDFGRRGLVDRAEDRLVSRVGLPLLAVGATAWLVSLVLLGGSWSTRGTAVAIAGAVAGGEVLFAPGLFICLPRWLDDGRRAARVGAWWLRLAGLAGLAVTAGALIRARGDYLVPTALFALVPLAALMLGARFMRRAGDVAGPGLPVERPSSPAVEPVPEAVGRSAAERAVGRGITGAGLGTTLGGALLAGALGLLFVTPSTDDALTGFLVLAAAAGLLGVGLPELVVARLEDGGRAGRRMGSVLLGLAAAVLVITAAGVAFNRTPYAAAAVVPALVLVVMVEIGRRLRSGRLQLPTATVAAAEPDD